MLRYIPSLVSTGFVLVFGFFETVYLCSLGYHGMSSVDYGCHRTSSVDYGNDQVISVFESGLCGESFIDLAMLNHTSKCRMTST